MQNPYPLVPSNSLRHVPLDERDIPLEALSFLLGSSIGGGALLKGANVLAQKRLFAPEKVHSFSEQKKLLAPMVGSSEKMKALAVELYDPHNIKNKGLIPAFLPYKNTIRVPTNVDTGVFSHELGHAKHMLHSKLPIKAQMFLRRGLPVAGLLAGTAMVGSGKEKLKEWAPAVAASSFLPMLYQEGRASYSGFKGMEKAFGRAEAMKRLPKLLGALGVYAALPVGTYLGAKALLHLMKDKKESDRNLSKK